LNDLGGAALEAAKFPSGKVRCRCCCLRDLCAPDALARADIDFLKGFVKKQERRVRRGEQLYRMGEPFEALFAVHTGSFKTCVMLPDGSERVTSFGIAGDLMGMAGIDSGRQVDYAIALEESGVCLLPWARIEEAAGRLPLVRRQLLRMLSREIRRGETIGLMLGRQAAEGRFAAFLLQLSEAFANRGFNAREFRLSMSRPDIGSYLGLSAETVSRLFTRFSREGLIQSRGRQLALLRVDALARLRDKN
jgi:CRP/FNR family transcriptional regulator